MAITDPLLLSPDLLILPVAELPEDVRRKLDHAAGDWALTHPRLRAPSRLVDAPAAELLEEFRSPRTIVEAVIRYSQARDLDPEKTLEEAYPLLARLLSSGFLVAEGSEEAGGIAPSLQPGDLVEGFEVLECVQTLEDTEVHLARRGGETAALKIERRGGSGAADAFAREAAVLGHLAGAIAPRFLAAGEVPGGRGGSAAARRWIALEWFPGADAATAAAGLRGRDRRGLLDLCRAILAAYAGLHGRGVIHADVHPRNVLVGRDGEVRLVDFGLARWHGAAGGAHRLQRGGVGFFYEPEYAAALLAGEPPPAASPAGEQYAVAALLYLLIAGAHTHDFKLSQEAMLRQIIEQPPLPFSERGAEPWPRLEEVLGKALAKAPADRFSSMAELAAALRLAAPPPSRQASGRPAAEALLARVLDRLGMDGPLFREGLPEPPRASLTYGAAGVACGLHRIALSREDPELLALADLWAEKAAAETGDGAFFKPGTSLDAENLGPVTPYHTVSGIHAVRARIAHAQGDSGLHGESLDAFVAAAGAACENPDLTLGRSGVLLAAALLREPLDDPPSGLTALGDRLLAELWAEIDALPAIPKCSGRWNLRNLGIAHGWAGYLYASLRWCRAAGLPPPGGLPRRLDELATCAHPSGRGLRWPWLTGDGQEAGTMPGWCNGSAGLVFLWTLAHRMLGDERCRVLAEGAAWNAWEALENNGSLCCGLAGRAYALLNLYRHGGGGEWLQRARALAERAAVAVERNAPPFHSLYKGALGAAVLAADLARPEEAAMPFFEEEGWV